MQAALGLTRAGGGTPHVGHPARGRPSRRATATDLRAEAEIALRVGDDGAATGYATAIELVDVGRPPPGGLEAIVEENIFHRGFVVGPWSSQAPSG